jgi:hypothetical protein
MYTELKMTQLERSNRIVLSTYEYGKATLTTENVRVSLHSSIVTQCNDLYYTCMDREG